jgi:predicted Zn-dependent peptidase
VSWEAALKEVKKYFLDIPASMKGGKSRVVEKQEKPAESVFHKDSDQTHLVLGFRAFSVFDKRRYALKIMTDILGGGMSSRLFQRIREEMGAAYYVNASDDLYSDHGLFTMASGVQHQKIEEVIKAALEEFWRFREELVPPAELKRAKDHLTGSMFISLEGSDEIGGFYASQEIMGMPLISPSFLASALKAVKAEEIRSVARAILRPERLNLALIGPFEKRSFKNILTI